MTAPAAPSDWRPAAGVETARLRAAMLGEVHRFFAARDVLLVDTPALSPSAVSDPSIESLSTRLSATKAPQYLHSSPEFCMKRMLAAGFPDIGQVCRVFRDGEVGRLHQPEFTMIEWYRRDFGLDDMIDESETLLDALLPAVRLPAERLSYRDAFEKYAGVDPLRADIAELKRPAAADAELSAALGDERDAWLDLLMSTVVAPAFDRDRLTTVFHYPKSQAALARICPQDADVADRFEIFQGSVELANGYVELTDHREQAARFAADQEVRRQASAPRRPLDTRLIASLRAGLPACAGVAVGFDRLLMLRAGVDDVREVLHFPFSAQE